MAIHIRPGPYSIEKEKARPKYAAVLARATNLYRLILCMAKQIRPTQNIIETEKTRTKYAARLFFISLICKHINIFYPEYSNYLLQHAGFEYIGGVKKHRFWPCTEHGLKSPQLDCSITVWRRIPWIVAFVQGTPFRKVVA